MSNALAALAALGLLGGAVMVYPKPQFSLFNFKFIKYFGPRAGLASAGAGAAIDEDIYTVDANTMVLLLSAGVVVAKTTGTAMRLKVTRKHGSITPDLHLIDETSANNEFFCWPQNKAASTLRVVAWHPLFLNEGDLVTLTHALTGGETINDSWHLNLIEYTDPRYMKG